MRLMINHQAVVLAAALLAGSMPALAHEQPERDYLNIVGSTTVYPFAALAAEQLVKAGKLPKPMLQASGSGGGFMLFCHGNGVEEADITLASRKIRASERERCNENGVTDIVEIKIGYDGIVLAGDASSAQMDLALRDIYLALASSVPAAVGEQEMTRNTYRSWDEVDRRLPKRPIKVYGPVGGSGTRYVFARLGMEAGCRSFDWLRNLKREDPATYRQNCRKIRDDVYIAAGENDEATLEKLSGNADALAVFSFGFVDRNAERLRVLPVGGVMPTLETIADDSYPLTRPLYLYVKQQHIGQYPGIRTFLAEITSESAWGDAGYLTGSGLVPMSVEERAHYRDLVEKMRPQRDAGK
jgi:phosphate transport system substrate-binding protein